MADNSTEPERDQFQEFKEARQSEDDAYQVFLTHLWSPGTDAKRLSGQVKALEEWDYHWQRVDELRTSWLGWLAERAAHLGRDDG